MQANGVPMRTKALARPGELLLASREHETFSTFDTLSLHLEWFLELSNIFELHQIIRYRHNLHTTVAVSSCGPSDPKPGGE